MFHNLAKIAANRETFTLATVVEADEGLSSLTGKKLLCAGEEVSGELCATSIGPAVAASCQEARGQPDGFQLKEITSPKGNATVIFESYHPVARLLVLGGGHIAQPLVKIAALLQYRITVIDDRPEFANSERFPEAEVICQSFIPALKQQPIDAGTSVVIITRGHLQDLDCLEYLLQFEPGYLGMIGSRRRIKLVKQSLLDNGYPEQRVSRVNMPIGLEIGAQTPAEIAVSIAAQLIEARRGRGLHPMNPTSTNQQWELLQSMLETINKGEPLVEATIIRTRGSTPRQAGAKMLVFPDGSTAGTIGGGCGEAAVYREALKLFHHGGCKLYSMKMNADVTAGEGMACGGDMDVFLQKLN